MSVHATVADSPRPMTHITDSHPPGTSSPTAAHPPLLQLRNVRLQRGKGRRLQFELQVDAEFSRPQVIGLFGANGAGKSTLMQLIAGELDPTSGGVQVHGHDIRGIRRHERQRLVRYHPQPQMDKAQKGRVAAIALHPVAWFRSLREVFNDMLRRRPPAGGPHVYLYDEPPLAPPYGGLLFDRFASRRQEGHLVIFATHPEKAWHLNLIRGVCDRYVFMLDGQPRFFDTFEDFMADADVADYLAAMK